MIITTIEHARHFNHSFVVPVSAANPFDSLAAISQHGSSTVIHAQRNATDDVRM